MATAGSQVRLPSGLVTCFRGGTGPGTELVLLHGGGVDSAHFSWEPMWPDLVASGPVLAPDLPGFGATPLGAVSPSVRGYRDWLLAFLDAAGVERAILVGLSLGGAVALDAALTAPDRVAGLVLLSPYGISPHTPWGRLGWVMVHIPGLEWLTSAALRHSRIAVRRSLAVLLRRPGSLTDETIVEVQQLLRAPDAGAAWQQFQRDEVRWAGPRTDLRPMLGELRSPTLLACAEHDLIAESDVRAAAARIPNAKFVLVAGAGHALPRDAPADIAAEIIKLRREIDSDGGGQR
jgi:pimeloyl-ACP methyl ester carboxylesterase